MVTTEELERGFRDGVSRGMALDPDEMACKESTNLSLQAPTQGATPVESLLPGITDEVTKSHILKKLPMPLEVSAVSRAWRKMYHEMKLVAKFLGQMFVVVIHRHPSCPVQPIYRDKVVRSRVQRGEEYGVSIYDVQQDKWNLLPDLPDGIMGRSIPYECALAVLNGKIYILGGENDDGTARKEVYMLDMARRSRDWETCATMTHPRAKFACCALDGKIYAFGGSSTPKRKYSNTAEVYDPEQNSWSPIAEMLHHQMYHSVSSWVTEIYISGGITVLEVNDLDEVVRDGIPNFAQCYNPVTDKWRKLDRFSQTGSNFLSFSFALVVVEGKLYKFTSELSGSVYDLATNSWTDLEACNRFTDMRIDWPEVSGGSVGLETYVAVAVGSEVFALVNASDDFDFNEIAIVRSRGFGPTSPLVRWRRVFCPWPFGDDFQSMLSFQL